ncbi:MAG: 2-oxo acid dehydrogenase subunit E2, partial [Acidimicrobiia bacterium]|nr:2-oxo acid dehydrogenase subunit E2 [Acidimicrobiia bacterium]
MTTVAFRLPDVGEGLEEAEVVRWLVAEGEAVARDQPLVEVLTDKAQVELPSPVDGHVVRLGPAEGDIVKVGSLLVELSAEGGPAAPAAGPTVTQGAPAGAPG